MLQFWKRSGQKEKTRSTTPPPSPSRTKENNTTCKEYTSVSCAEILLELKNEGLCDTENVKQQNSRLSKTLSEVLSDKSALSYFIQFLEIQKGLPFVKCWLDIESFQSAAEQIETIYLNSVVTRDQLEENFDNLSVSTDCDYSDNSDRMTTVKSSQTLVDDALRIFKKYIAHDAVSSINITENLRNEVIESICTETGILDRNCYKKIQQHVYETMKRNYFADFQQSVYQIKHQIDILTSGNICLQDVLYNESILFYFMEFLEQENARTLLEFWLAATNFSQQLQSANGEYDREEAQNDSIVLYNRYFSLQATCSLGFDDTVRFAIEENICDEGGPFPNCFTVAVNLVEFVLEKHFLQPFFTSQLYFKYLSELISAVQTNGLRSTHSKSRSIASDCSSEFSASKNTLLATDDTKSRKKHKNDMNIDVKMLYDPDSLWRRSKNKDVLSFGRITDFGRFETAVEPEPNKKSESLLTKAVKRLVNAEESKTKEELAWKVAEMIVKDVTDVTMASNVSMCRNYELS